MLCSSGCHGSPQNSKPGMIPGARREVLLVGSVGLKNSEEVFRTVGPVLGGRRKRIPDGETGPRTSWVSRVRFVLEGNPSFEDDPQEVAAGGRITTPTNAGVNRKAREAVPMA